MREPATRTLDQKIVNWAEQRKLNALLSSNGMAGKALLDVPCGYGRFWPMLDTLRPNLVGIDLDPVLVHKAANVNGRNGGSRAACSNVFQLPFAADSFDAVICIRMLHLNWSDAERAAILSELARVTRRLVIISLYRPTPLHALWRMVKGTPGRLRFTSDEQFSRLLEQGDLRLGSLNPLWHYLHMQTFVVLEKAGRISS